MTCSIISLIENQLSNAFMLLYIRFDGIALYLSKLCIDLTQLWRIWMMMTRVSQLEVMMSLDRLLDVCQSLNFGSLLIKLTFFLSLSLSFFLSFFLSFSVFLSLSLSLSLFPIFILRPGEENKGWVGSWNLFYLFLLTRKLISISIFFTLCIIQYLGIHLWRLWSFLFFSPSSASSTYQYFGQFY